MDISVVLQWLSSIAWLVALGLIILSVMRAAQGRKFKAAVAVIVGAIIFAVLLTSLSAGLIFIQPTDRGVVISALDEGIRPEALSPGLNWVVPFLENVITYPISRQTYTMSIAPEEGEIKGDDSVEARTSDGQIVKVDASVIFSIDAESIVETHVKWQGRYVDNLIRPLSRGIIRDGVSQFGIEEIYSSQRFELSRYISDTLASDLGEGGIIVHDFVLRNIAFSEEYAASVEQKQIAEQLAQQAAFVVQQREQEAEQARQVAKGQADAVEIQAEGAATALVTKAKAEAESRLIKAEAEAEALELIAAALRDNPQVLTFEYIDKLAPGIQIMLVPSDNPWLLPLPSLEEGAGVVTPSVVP
jgi:regulator of protease activity HflC (stomatin/prohibitin superfamily)